MIPATEHGGEARDMPLRGVQRTMLITLNARALESRSPDPILRDPTAERLVEQLATEVGELSTSSQARFGVSVRARRFDTWTAEYLADHPDATVLHLGCGLDSRVIRVDPPGTTRWFDIDLPEVIALRRKLYAERPGCRMIAASITDLDWLLAIPDDRPTLIVAEGVFLYLPDAAVVELLRRLVATFPEGQIMFDAMSRQALRLQPFIRDLRRTGARLVWALDDARSLEQRVPGLELVEEVSLVDAPEVARLSLPRRLGMRLLARSAGVRRLHRLLRYRF